MSLNDALYTVKQIRAIESGAIAQTSEDTLMARAGASAFLLLKEKFPDSHSMKVLCGAGNNGGDGFVLAAHAKASGMQVSVLTVGEMDNLSDTAKNAYLKLKEEGISTHPFDLNETLDDVDVIVDGLLGIGLTGNVREPYVDVINRINESEAFVMALDLPSGIDADTGKCLGVAVYAAMTVTFIGVKQGLLTGEAQDHTGEIFLSTLEIEEEIEKHAFTAWSLNEKDMLASLPIRSKGAHKGMLGHVLVIGGDIGMAGAARLSAEAALRVGAGCVTVATRPEHLPVMLSGRPELMCFPIETEKDLLPLLDKANVCVVGPGLGDSEWARSLIKRALTFTGPKVCDAGVLSFVSASPTKIENAIITPHPGEASCLLGLKSEEVQADRFQAAIKLAVQFADTVVLKGAGTIVQTLNEVPEICHFGNPGMATAGMGDVLAGIIGGLCAQSCTNEEAAKAGVILHALAADKAVIETGEAGLLASDLFSYFSTCVQIDSIGYDWVSEDDG